MTSYTIKLRTTEYRISTDVVVHSDGSQSRHVFCDGKLITHPSLHRLPKTVTNALYRELAAAD